MVSFCRSENPTEKVTKRRCGLSPSSCFVNRDHLNLKIRYAKLLGVSIEDGLSAAFYRPVIFALLLK